MSQLKIVLEHTPTPQASTAIAYHGGQLVVGRGDDADWRIDDPDKFVSRKHFVISEDGDDVVVTDASTGGLFVDGSSAALGAGNSVKLEHGMRLRFGDFVARVEVEGSQSAAEGKPTTRASSPRSFSFEPVSRLPPKSERPKDLPAPFGARSSDFFDAPDRSAQKPVQPIDRDDPFALDLKPTPPTPKDTPRPAARGSGSDYFGAEPGDAAPAPDPAPTTPSSANPPLEREAAFSPPARPAGADEAELRAAFFRGLGLDPRQFPQDDPRAEMEALGRRFRALTDGLLHLLRTRAEEKQKVRVAQTIIGSANVNPLKFAVGADDAVSALVAARGAGYLNPDDAISEAYRDLVDHQLRTWTALQAALRRMVDKFDPEAIERELEDTGLLQALIAGGRRAKLWQLYEERYREMARAAEERFLGEIGADFRDAYENKGRSSP